MVRHIYNHQQWCNIDLQASHFWLLQYAVAEVPGNFTMHITCIFCCYFYIFWLKKKKNVALVLGEILNFSCFLSYSATTQSLLLIWLSVLSFPSGRNCSILSIKLISSTFVVLLSCVLYSVIKIRVHDSVIQLNIHDFCFIFHTFPSNFRHFIFLMPPPLNFTFLLFNFSFKHQT